MTVPLSVRAAAELELRRRSTSSDNIRYQERTDDELLAWVEHTWGVHIPRVQVAEGHSTPARAFCDAFFGRVPVSVWKASRGFGGKSFQLAVLGLTIAVLLAVDVNILGGSGEQSQRVLDHMRKLWDAPNAPRDLLATDPSKRETRLTNGARIQALMASQRSVRGGHPVALLLDEIDEMALDILDAAMGQPMSANGVPMRIVFSSTKQYYDGTMTEIEKRAAAKGWPIHVWGYPETLEPNGWLSQADVDQKRADVTAAMWAAEYDMDEPSPDSRAIQPDAVRFMFDDKYGGTFEGALHEYIEIEPPQKVATYSTGADWARKKDFTEIVTLRTDCNPARIIAFERTQRLDWPVMIDKYNQRVNRYPGAAFHDETGIGDVVGGFLSVPAKGVIMVGRDRADLITNYIAAIERREITAPFIRSLEGEHRYASVDDVYAGGEGHLPDGIAAGALAYRGITLRPWTDNEIERYRRNEITLSGVPQSAIDLARRSGVDVDRLLGVKKS